MIVPSIDIMNGKAVQLKQGKEFVLQSDRDPVDLAREFNRYGEIAVIDLDAAMGKGNNRELIKRICSVADARVGGGVRDVDTGKELLKAGARALIVGTKASPEFLANFPAERVMVALDHRDGEVVDDAWTRGTGETVYDRADRLSDYCCGFLVTFVEHEGGLGGMPVEQANEIASRLKRPVTVAGGVASTEEVVALSASGLDVQVGMGLYTGKIDPVESVVLSVDFAKVPLVPTVVQDTRGQVLMVAYSNAESLRRALSSGRGVYFSRSRNEIWEKGLTSGNSQELLACRLDCDRDTLLFTVRQTSAACHRQSYSCFGQVTAAPRFSLPVLFDLLKKRKEEMPEGSYSATLFQNRRKLMKKIMEEAHEVVSFDSKENLQWELADLIYFISVLAVDEGISWEQIEAELGGRYR